MAVKPAMPLPPRNRPGEVVRRRASVTFAWLALCVLLDATTPVSATAALNCPEDSPCPPPAQSIWAPYPFYNDNVDYAVGVVYAAAGVLQPQFGFVANAFASSNGTYAGFLLARDYQLGSDSRFFADLSLLGGEFGKIRSFQQGNPDYPDEIAGSNDSSESNYLEAEGNDLFIRVPLRYVLPIGAARDEVIHTYRTRGGLLLPETGTGGESWNPFAGGRTMLEVTPFHREQDLELEIGGERELSSTGVTARLDYDNTDWFNNPTSGSRTQFAITRDWSGDEPGNAPWTQVEAQYSKYWPLGPNQRAQQRVIAFDAWISDIPTWDDYDLVDGEPLFHRPPVLLGSTLGGLFRQRGFATNRFNDRSAINYTLEYRYTTVRNLLGWIGFLDRFGIDFTQLVGFVEAGRVAPEFDLGELHEDMKFTYGAGLRASAKGLIVRADFGASDEGLQIQMFVSQPF
ncbi:MAG TPA: hypothetical protein PLI00_05000 [Pseudomonadota bacterium]|nr:hypothetical protein [Pseudomonadota bacterium]HQY35914.1 hypothetical protein [Pseudomonadota bacterium]HRA37283.1 hypothetical protein [Pseudomonadota bacterium]